MATSAAFTAGCHSYQPLQIAAASVGHDVRVQFSTPRSVAATRTSGGDSVLALVSAIEGRVISGSRDTLSISVAKITDVGGEHGVGSGLMVIVGRDPSVAIDVLAVDEDKSAVAATLGVVTVAYVAVIVAVAAILASVYHQH